MVSLGMHTTHSWIRTSEDNMINAVHIITQWASSIGGRLIESNGMLLSRPEGVTHFLVSKLTGWNMSFYIGSVDWGSGLYGMVEPLPAILMVARDMWEFNICGAREGCGPCAGVSPLIQWGKLPMMPEWALTL
eukprot:1095600-Pelagomonas_calceolata.AAC.1